LVSASKIEKHRYQPKKTYRSSSTRKYQKQQYLATPMRIAINML